MKYIVILIDNKETIFVFPKVIDHDRFFENLCHIRMGPDHNWQRHVIGTEYPIAAGFTDGLTCWGKSETLKLESRGDQDLILLRIR